ncbi:hypothetical protein [Bacillus paralicheniformis]|uniref:hypothetical protein n=1 Tax=Bacillus paralicheniformis TaxID=1648923 RepID=UPI001FD71CE9|nr:hypothetical protein [Bacillus paralicheniformis]MCJ8223729.1 hypothetical protein [Bacillus paralicheniformis]
MNNNKSDSILLMFKNMISYLRNPENKVTIAICLYIVWLSLPFLTQNKESVLWWFGIGVGVLSMVVLLLNGIFYEDQDSEG